MKEIRYVKGDLVEALLKREVDYIAHQCNCFNTMGSGIAKQIKEKIPEAYIIDSYTPKGSNAKLGKFTLGGNVFNLYGQYNYGNDGSVYTNYEALRSSFKSMLGYLKNIGKINVTIGIPKLGSGLAGGDWDVIYGIIYDEVMGSELNLELLIYTL